MLRFDTFTTAIFQQFQATFDGAAGSMLAACSCCAAWCCSSRGIARGRLDSPASVRGAVHGDTDSPGPHGITSTVGAGDIARACRRVPVWTILRWLWIGGPGVGARRIGTALGQTIGLATAAALLTTMLAFPVAWVAVRSGGVLARVVEGELQAARPARYCHSARPGYRHYSRRACAVPERGSSCAPVLLFMPRALVSVRAGLAQVPTSLEEASRSLGKSPSATFIRVTLRLTAPAAAAGASLVFVAVATELTATLYSRRPAPGHCRCGSGRWPASWTMRPAAPCAGTGGTRHTGHAGAVPAIDEGGRAVTTPADILVARNLAGSFNGSAVLQNIDCGCDQGVSRPWSARRVAARPHCGSSPASRHRRRHRHHRRAAGGESGKRCGGAPSGRRLRRTGRALFPHLTVGRRTFPTACPAARSAPHRRVAELPSQHRWTRRMRRAGRISSPGQQQRVALARALARRRC